MSRVSEKQGTLYYPVQLVPETMSYVDDLVISVLHHPYNWFEATNARTLRSMLERSSDLILTGHEHDGAFYRKVSPSGEVVHYTEGAVLQDSNNPGNSGFNVLVLDVGNKLQTLFSLHWSTDLYRPREVATRMPLIRNSLLAQRRFEPSQEHSKWLADPGTGFSHQHKSQITLSDLFVYPDLRRTSLKAHIQADSEHKKSVQSTSVANELFSRDHAMVYGPEASGKTTLAKVLYSETGRRVGAVPLYMTVTHFSGGRDEKQWIRAIETAFVKQYSSDALDEYRQLDKRDRLLLLDDFHKVQLNSKGQKLFLRFLASYFGRLFVFADDLFRIAELATEATEEAFLGSFEEYEIRQFGHQLRERLISTEFRII
jgi:hypothetical protein